jgi:hypothetical protein
MLCIGTYVRDVSRDVSAYWCIHVVDNEAKGTLDVERGQIVVVQFVGLTVVQ